MKSTLDTVILSSVVSVARHVLGANASETVVSLDRAFAEGRVNADKVTDRLVRATWSPVQRVAAAAMSEVANPFPSPHNLSWYLGTCTCPDEIRMLATSLRNVNTRVWSVAQTVDGWSILVQVGPGADPVAQVAQLLPVPVKKMRKYRLDSVTEVANLALPWEQTKTFIHKHAKSLMDKGVGTFVLVDMEQVA